MRQVWCRGWLASALALATVLAGCAGGRSVGSGPEVVATTAILGDVTAEILAGVTDVTVIMEGGADPHAFQPSAAEVATIRRADLVVANGLGLEEGLDDVLTAARDDGVEVLRVAEHLDPIGEGRDRDPHVWLDPVRMAEGVSLIAEALAAAAPDSAERIRANADRYRGEVLAAHERISALLAAVPEGRRRLVTNHDALGYLAARYDLEVVGVIVPGGGTLADVAPQQLSELARRLRELDAPAVFVESTAPTRLADALTREVPGLAVVRLHMDALGPPGSGADSYLGMLLADAQRIADALGRDPG